MSGLFEHLAYTEQEDRTTVRKAVALARARAERRFGKFVRQAHDQADQDGRLALVAGELEETVRQACADVGYLYPESIHESIVAHLGGAAEIEKLALRKPRMCPYHREVMDISLAAGDPAAGFSAMAQHAWSTNHCQGSDYEGERCKFKPEMATQSYWDTKAEKAEQRRQERQLQQEQTLLPELEVDPEIQADFEALDEADNSFDAPDQQLTAPELDFAEVSPEMPVMARHTRVAVAVVGGMWHGGTAKPLGAINKNTGGQLQIDGVPFDQWAQNQRESSVNVEVTHPDPTWEHVAADCLQVGHDGPLKKFMVERKQQRQQQQAQQPPEGGPGGPVQASTFRESEALETVDVTKGGEGPSPKMDKSKWTPENVKWDQNAEMSGSRSPTRQQDINEPVNYTDGDDDSRFDQTDTVLEKQDVTKDSNPTDGGGPHTDTWSGSKGLADPVTSAKDPDKNPIQEAIEEEEEDDDE